MCKRLQIARRYWQKAVSIIGGTSHIRTSESVTCPLILRVMSDDLPLSPLAHLRPSDHWPLTWLAVLTTLTQPPDPPSALCPRVLCVLTTGTVRSQSRGGVRTNWDTQTSQSGRNQQDKNRHDILVYFIRILNLSISQFLCSKDHD